MHLIDISRNGSLLSHFPMNPASNVDDGRFVTHADESGIHVTSTISGLIRSKKILCRPQNEPVRYGITILHTTLVQGAIHITHTITKMKGFHQNVAIATGAIFAMLTPPPQLMVQSFSAARPKATRVTHIMSQTRMTATSQWTMMPEEPAPEVRSNRGGRSFLSAPNALVSHGVLWFAFVAVIYVHALG